ncbi:cell division protein FtsA [Tellurirhabdus rosea]|uniref:cell division protein FtsA n=1 Tax=Tellurirhabdus rosea TaxID=2674997 RepID=UPI00224DFC65|nr:cell division protein FtsA [Tellurirhabdus rosea]
MKDEKYVVGLDIGSTKVCAVAGRLIRDNNYTRLDVLGVGRASCDGVVKGTVKNVKRTAEAVRKAIDEVAGQANLNINVVNVAFSGSHISSRKQHGSITRTSHGDEVTVADVDHLVADMYRTVTPVGNEIVHVLPMDFTVDNETGIDDPVGRSGVKLEADFQVIMAQTALARSTRKSISDINLSGELMLISPLASAMAVLTDEERQAGVVLVDIGGGTTDIAIYHRNVLRHIAVLPFAGNTITSDIEQGCKVMNQQAEQLKVKFGSADPNDFTLKEIVSVPVLSGRPPKDVLLKNLALIIEARVKEIAAMVQAEVRRSGFEDKLYGGVVLTGGTAAIPGIETLFERITGMHTRVGLPDLLERNPKADLVSEPSYATAVGLVWAGFKSLDERVPVSRAAAAEPAPPVAPPVVSRSAPTVKAEAPAQTASRESFWEKLKKYGRTILTDDVNLNDKYSGE